MGFHRFFVALNTSGLQLWQGKKWYVCWDITDHMFTWKIAIELKKGKRKNIKIDKTG